MGYVERDAYAAAVLLARMEAKDLEPAPIWCGDLERFDATVFRGRVDFVSGGFPCQPFSSAGKGLGKADPRWLWPDFRRIIADADPSLVFVENAPWLAIHGLDDVLEGLALLGFDAEWDCFTARAVGAPHIRKRFFLVAWRASDAGRFALRQLTEQPGRDALPPEQRDAESRHMGKDMGDADERGEPESSRTQQEIRRRPGDAVSRFPPGPDDEEGWRKWIAGGGPEPGIRRGTDGPTDRVDRLCCLGNAVVPAQAAHAIQMLARRAL